MRRINSGIPGIVIFMLLALLFAGQSCTSKRLARQAQKHEDAGLYELAADKYLRSYRANARNVDAATGLRRTAQRTLDSRVNLVIQAYLSGNDRETVYNYIEALEYRQLIRNAGIDLTINNQALKYYEEARPRYLDGVFEEARLLLEEENFSRAEILLSEIKRIDPSYQDVNHYMKISRSEPLYRSGVEELGGGYYRKAYYTFTNLLKNHGAYKDARELREDALNRGRLTIAVADFSNNSRQRDVNALLRSRITGEISNLGNPFIQVVDDKNIEAFLKKQELASRLGSDLKIGELAAAKALLTGNIINLNSREGRLQRAERRAWLRETATYKNKETGEEITEIIYHKVTFYEYLKENIASGSFQYQLSSTETGTVMVSGVIELKPGDRIHYAEFKGNTDNLIPGHWEHADKDSPKDKINDEKEHIEKLQGLLSAKRTVKTTEQLRAELIDGIAKEVSQAINEFNPEQ